MILAAWLMALPLSMTSCDDVVDTIEDELLDEEDDYYDNPKTNDSDYKLPKDPLPKSEYTIIFYGHGGGDLDWNILWNIDDLFTANKSSYDKVHATVMYKMSGKDGLTVAIDNGEFEDMDVDEYGHATFRFVVKPSIGMDSIMDQYFYDATINDRDIDIASTTTLTNYIKWAKEKAPAEKYILIISDHGCGYSPKDELPLNSPSLSKGVVYDDGANFDHLTAEKIAKAITDAGIRPEVIYMDACLMNTIEYHYELKDLTNYLMLSTFSVPGSGGKYNSLIDELASNSNIETALANVCDATVKAWDEELYEDNEQQVNPYSDLSVIRTADIDQFGNLWKTFTEQLISAYQSNDKAKAAINKVTSEMLPITDGYPMYDMNYYAKKIIESIPSYFDKNLDKDLETAYNNYVFYRRASADLEKFGYKIGASVMLGCKNHYTAHLWDRDEETGEPFLTSYITYEEDGRMLYFEVDGTQYDENNWNSTLDNTYKRLKFDQLTHWSDWIEINEQETGSYCPSEFEAEITADGFVPKEY